MTKTLFARPEHKESSRKNTAQKVGLFSGVSAAALMLGATGNDAAAAGITITKTTKQVVIGTKQHFDFVDIQAPVINDVVNNGSLGPGDSPTLYINGGAIPGGSVGGDIINNGLITGTMAGIFVSGTKANPDPVGGGIYNFGTIEVFRGTKTKLASSAFGVLISGPAVSTTVSNTGLISVGLFASGTGHTAGGVVISSTGPLASNITNSGGILVGGFAVGSTGLADTDAQMLALGAVATNTAGAGATLNTITNNTGGLIGVGALAFASGPFATASATAIGAGALHFGTSGAANVASVSNATSATIGAFAFAGAFGTTSARANAFALGVNQAGLGGSALTQNISNAGSISASASAFAVGSGFVNANATAAAIVQAGGASPSITQNVNNSGQINAFAFAGGFATTVGTPLANANASSATALGVGQFASGGTGTVSNSLSVTNSTQGSINVVAVGVGVGTQSPDGIANATGVSQASSGNGSHSLTFSNAGDLSVLALGTAIGTTNPEATATAIAVRQTVAAGAGATNIALGITNAASGSIGVTASAFAGTLSSATEPEAFVGVNGSAVLVQTVAGAPGGSSVTLNITNQGSMNFNYVAAASGTSADAETGRISGRWQQVSGSPSTATASFSNATSANFTVNALAFAFGTNGPSASASAVGGWQTVNSSGTASANVANNGTFNVNAFALASGDNPYAYANVDTGLYQNVSAGGGGVGSSATATITNTSLLSLNLNATAIAVGTSRATATASLTAVYQTANNAETASVSIDNSGAINLGVRAVALATTAGGDASASALISRGFSQSANANMGSQLSASVDFNNSGAINATISAFATAPDSANATAYVSNFFFQRATNGDAVSASFTNTATGSINLNMNASAVGTNVYASGTIADAFLSQRANAGDDNVSASASFLNDGTVSVAMNISAFGTDGTGGPGTVGTATISVDDFFTQDVDDGNISSASFVNNGSILIDLNALVTNVDDASASIEFNSFLVQTVEADGSDDSVASALFSNNGLIDIDFNATANGVTDAEATAQMDLFLGESASNAETATFTIVNSATGVIDINIVGMASAPSGNAQASGYMTSFVEASAYASAADQALAAVSITNDGIIAINLSGIAMGSGTADADAYLSYGFYDYASQADVASIDFTNTNSITFDMNAFALASDAEADASFFYPFYFQASASDDRVSADVTFTNSASGVITAHVNATAIGTNGTGGVGSHAEASAEYDTVFSTYAYGGDDVSITFTNDGTLSFWATALASHASDVSATADFDYGIYQIATAHSSPNNLSANVIIDNNGNITFAAVANAFGVSDAEASASFDDTVVYQSADGAGESHALFDNSGNFTVLLSANAIATTGSADASATFGSQFLSQLVYADDGTGMNASAIFNNSGNVTVNVLANAWGGTQASATADFTETVFYQSATATNFSGGATAVVELNNTATGTLDFQAVAKATGTDAFATATFDDYLFYQTANADDGDVASVSFTNDGTVNFLAQASALGIPTSLSSPAPTVSAYATYDSSVIYQRANHAANASASIVNNGTINVTAWAFASNGSDVEVSASLGYGFYQTVDVSGATGVTGGVASASITNTSNLSINFLAMAQAIGITSASASAEFDDSIIYQSVEGETATATVDNSGAFNVNVIALATASGNGTTGYAFASASIDDGFEQNANANNNDGDRLFAGTFFNNSGTVVFNNVAMAQGTTQASAFAYNDYGLYQYPDNADEVYAEFINDGSFTLSANAWAKGSDVFAYASTSTLVSQSANPGDDNLSAEALLVNNGTLGKQIRATAIGTDGSSGPGSTATATAYGGYGIEQYAYNGLTGTATINNNGNFYISVTAIASNAIDASANAYLYRGVSQTAQAINTTGSTADATFTNTSLTSFDININAKAVGVTDAYALASLTATVLYQTVENAEVATALIDNSGAINVNMLAMATAAGNGVTGDASANNYLDYGIFQTAQANFGDQLSATATFNNSGIIDFNQVAMAQGTTRAYASVSQNQYLFFQGASQGDNVSASFTNDGTITQFLGAHASGAVDNEAYAYGNEASFGQSFYQEVDAGDDNLSASATFVNGDGATVDLMAIASAIGSASATSAYASAAFFQYIILQEVEDGFNSSALIQNDGTFNVLASAFASNPNSNGFAQAYVELESGIVRQSVDADSGAGSSSTATLNNTSHLSLDYIGIAEARGGTSALATATVESTYIFQNVFGAQNVSNSLTNSGAMNLLLDAQAVATGNGTTGYAFATAFVEEGIVQWATANGSGSSDVATNTINNVVGPPSSVNGSLFMGVVASAQGTTAATANADIETAIWQYAQGSGENTNFFNNNTGSVLMMADADARGGTFASANATVTRLWQTVNPYTSDTVNSNIFHNRNSASFVVDADARANVTGTGASAVANAYAEGVSQYNANPAAEPEFNAVFVNDNQDNFKNQPQSLFLVQAFASATGGTVTNSANAFAEGYRVFTNTNTNPHLDITNNSTFRVQATALGSTAQATAWGMVLEGGELDGTINNGGQLVVRASAPSGTASAVGVQMNSAINNTVFTNVGTISAFALGSTTAVAVRYDFQTGHTIMATKSDHALFINDGGTVMAAVNSSGTLGFGTAFDLSGAPNAVTLDFRGTNQRGTVWGDIWLSDDDNIFVNNGMTYYAGMINSSAAYNGFLTIGSSGTLTMASTATGPAVGYFDTYTNTATGTLAFNVTPSTPTTGLGQINALTANLGGTVQLNIVPGLYANSQTYQDVVVVTTPTALNGTFANTSINTNTPLLSLQAIYPGDGTVDLALTRNSFASPAGLTINQMGAGMGLDLAYSTGLTGAFGSMVSNLFGLTSAAYQNALEQLHGSEHVQNLRTNLWSTNLLNYALDERINAGTYSNDRSNNSDSIIRRGDTTFWGSYQGTTGDLEGDIEASGYDLNQNGFYAGFDHAISDDLLVGFAAGFYRSRLNFTNGSDKDDEGVQLALYAAYDTQKWYARGNFSLGYYNADSNRMINLPTQIGVARGDYNVNVTSFHGEVGTRLALGDNAYVSPYIALDYARAKNKAFSETGLTGANLALPENTVKSFRGEVGARFATSIETGSNSILVPEAYFGYRHEFKDEILSITSSYAAAPGSNFNVISSAVDSGEFIAGAGVAFSKGDKVEIKLMYHGRFNSQIEEHGFGLRLSVLLGKRN